MTLLLDTHLLLWATITPERLPAEALAILEDPSSDLWFSAASVWEVSIKHGRQQPHFTVEPQVFRRELLTLGFAELAISGAHGAAAGLLPPIHRDPFDRVLVAQAITEGITLVTRDATVARYPGPIQLI